MPMRRCNGADAEFPIPSGTIMVDGGPSCSLCIETGIPYICEEGPLTETEILIKQVERKLDVNEQEQAKLGQEREDLWERHKTLRYQALRERTSDD